jgi:hypothetical protein
MMVRVPVGDLERIVTLSCAAPGTCCEERPCGACYARAWAKKILTSAKGTPLSVLCLSARAGNCAAHNGVLHIEDLATRSAAEVRSWKNMGKTCLNEIRKKLAERGLALRGETAYPEPVRKDIHAVMSRIRDAFPKARLEFSPRTEKERGVVYRGLDVYVCDGTAEMGQVKALCRTLEDQMPEPFWMVVRPWIGPWPCGPQARTARREG